MDRHELPVYTFVLNKQSVVPCHQHDQISFNISLMQRRKENKKQNIANNQTIKSQGDSWSQNGSLKTPSPKPFVKKSQNISPYVSLYHLFHCFPPWWNKIIPDVFVLSPQKEFCAFLFCPFDRFGIALMHNRRRLLFAQSNEECSELTNDHTCVRKRDLLSFSRAVSDALLSVTRRIYDSASIFHQGFCEKGKMNECLSNLGNLLYSLCIMWSDHHWHEESISTVEI